MKAKSTMKVNPVAQTYGCRRLQGTRKCTEIHSRSRTRMQSLARQALAMEGTRPSCVTRARSTNTPNGRPSGDPWHCTTPSMGFARSMTCWAKLAVVLAPGMHCIDGLS